MLTAEEAELNLSRYTAPSRPCAQEIFFAKKLITPCNTLRPLEPSRSFPWEGDFIPVPQPGQCSVDFDASVKLSCLCSLCKDLQSWMQKEITRDVPIEEYWPTLDYVANHYSIGTDLEESAKRGCHLCTLIYYNFIHSSFHKELNRHLVTEDLRDISILIRYFPNGKNFAKSSGNIHFFLEPEVEVGIVPSMGVSTLRDHYLAPESVRNSIYTASSAFWSLAESWIQACNHSHNCCMIVRDQPSSVPSRLIELQSTEELNDLKLIENTTQPWNLRYVTLSYCWGGDTVFRLLRNTIHSMRSGFSSQSLPATIRDAITVTRKLNIKYIWIDSLCIVQDSKADWTKEARLMGDIYRNSYLTIAALGSRNSAEGLFAQRDPLKYNPCRLLQSDCTTDIFVEPLDDETNRRLVLEDSFDRAPLHSRGWVMQERLLSPRTLNFGQSVFWECRQNFQHEFSIVPYRERDSIMGNPKTAFLPGSNTFENDVSSVEFWVQKIVPLYSATKLTVKTDRFIALQGIVNEFHHNTGWQSLYGMWKPYLLEQCLWSVNLGRDSSFLSQTRIPGTPTWSWVSVGSQVSYPLIPSLCEFFRAGITPYHVEQQHHMSLVISSSLFEVAPVQNSIITPVRNCQKMKLTHHSYAFFIGTWIFDTHMEEPVPLGHYYFLPLLGVAQVECPGRRTISTFGSRAGERSGIIMGLVVIKSPQLGIERYYRVGFLSMPAWQFRPQLGWVPFKEVIGTRRLKRITLV
ncbi:heterokaryon incompatibility protein-domain-containing protein [Tricladium varicosporioides]|nr:heterokaryon incompatibility protein-domain-containing protein [Hymenoscyphus varicosporioides]